MSQAIVEALKSNIIKTLSGMVRNLMAPVISFEISDEEINSHRVIQDL